MKNKILSAVIGFLICSPVMAGEWSQTDWSNVEKFEGKYNAIYDCNCYYGCENPIKSPETATVEAFDPETSRTLVSIKRKFDDSKNDFSYKIANRGSVEAFESFARGSSRARRIVEANSFDGFEVQKNELVYCSHVVPSCGPSDKDYYHYIKVQWTRIQANEDYSRIRIEGAYSDGSYSPDLKLKIGLGSLDGNKDYFCRVYERNVSP